MNDNTIRLILNSAEPVEYKLLDALNHIKHLNKLIEAKDKQIDTLRASNKMSSTKKVNRMYEDIYSDDEKAENEL
jgi:hypothetical protein